MGQLLINSPGCGRAPLDRDSLQAAALVNVLGDRAAGLGIGRSLLAAYSWTSKRIEQIITRIVHDGARDDPADVAQRIVQSLASAGFQILIPRTAEILTAPDDASLFSETDRDGSKPAK
jgi:hypothetical protein